MLGGGLVGTATARAAARIGGDLVQVDLYEAATVGHEGGASIDVTRVFRHPYGDQAHYTRWTAEAVGLWRDLERECGRSLYQQTGAVWVANADAAAVAPPDATTSPASASSPVAPLEQFLANCEAIIRDAWAQEEASAPAPTSKTPPAAQATDNDS